MDLQTIRLIQFRAGYNLPVHAAMEAGLFGRHGLRVEVTYAPGSAYLIEGLKQGKFDIGHAAADDTIADVESSGSDLFLFLGIYGPLFSLMGSPDIRELGSLRGKTLAVDSRVSGFVFVLKKLLHSRGFSPDDYLLVEVGGWEKRFSGLIERKFSATLLTPPFTAQALDLGCHLLAQAREVVPVYQATCALASRKWAGENADMVVRYARAYIEATRGCFDPNNRKSCLELLARHNQVSAATAEKTLEELLDPRCGLNRDAELNLPGIATVIRLRREFAGLGEPIPPLEKYVDLSYHRKAIQSIRST